MLVSVSGCLFHNNISLPGVGVCFRSFISQQHFPTWCWCLFQVVYFTTTFPYLVLVSVSGCLFHNNISLPDVGVCFRLFISQQHFPTWCWCLFQVVYFTTTFPYLVLVSVSGCLFHNNIFLPDVGVCFRLFISQQHFPT